MVEPDSVQTAAGVPAEVVTPAEGDIEIVEVGPHRRRGVLWIAVTVGTVMALLVAVLATRSSALDKQARSPLLGHPAPPIDGASVTDAPFESMSALHGRWVVVNFFATWCVPCRREHPEFLRFTQRHAASDDTQLVMVIYADKTSEVQKFFATNGGGWPAVSDPAGRIALDFGVAGVPETYVIDPDGVAVAKIVGGVTADGLDRLLTRAKIGVARPAIAR